MIEMRWIMTQDSYERVLQFRQQVDVQVHTNALDYGRTNMHWSDWREVETFIQEAEDGS